MKKFDFNALLFMFVENDSNITLVEHEAAKWLSKENLIFVVDWLPVDIDAVDEMYRRLCFLILNYEKSSSKIKAFMFT